jgi:hypothetical protein
MILFLSHASSDRTLGEAIKEHVARLGVETYLAEHDNKAGASLSDKVNAALRRSQLVVVLLTRAGFDSTYVQQEIGAARHARKLVIPMLDESVEGHRERLAMLSGLEWIPLDPNAPADAVAALASRVAEIAAEQEAQDAAAEQAVFRAEEQRLGVEAAAAIEAARAQARHDIVLAAAVIVLILAGLYAVKHVSSSGQPVPTGMLPNG